jgi:hypothetical protein
MALEKEIMSNDTEERDYERMLARKTDGMRAFVAKPERSVSKSTVLYGTTGDWFSGMTCHDGDHYQRAKRYADRFNREDYADLLVAVLREAAPDLAYPAALMAALHGLGWTLARKFPH